MDDIEKSRVAYVQQLEAKMAHLQSEYQRLKTVAEKFEPKITSKTAPENGKTVFGLQFGGRFTHVEVSDAWLLGMDETTAVTEISRALTDAIVYDEIKKAVQPDLVKMRRAAATRKGAGQW